VNDRRVVLGFQHLLLCWFWGPFVRFLGQLCTSSVDNVHELFCDAVNKRRRDAFGRERPRSKSPEVRRRGSSPRRRSRSRSPRRNDHRSSSRSGSPSRDRRDRSLSVDSLGRVRYVKPTIVLGAVRGFSCDDPLLPGIAQERNNWSVSAKRSNAFERPLWQRVDVCGHVHALAGAIDDGSAIG
jgi:hypothetical protein